jgi:hypothetical protein
MIPEHCHQSYSPFLPGPFVVQCHRRIVPFHWMLLVPGSHWYQVLFRTPVVRFQRAQNVYPFMTPSHHVSFHIYLSHTVICILPKDALLCSLVIFHCQPVCILAGLPLTLSVNFCRTSRAPESHRGAMITPNLTPFFVQLGILCSVEIISIS